MSSKKSLVGVVVVAIAALALVGWWLFNSDDQDAGTDLPTSSASEPAVSEAPDAKSTDTKSTEATPAPKPVEAKPVKDERSLTDPAPLAAGAEATVTKIESVQSSAELPGEISAPALRFTIKVTAGDDPLDLTPVVVNAYFGRERVPAVEMGKPGADHFTGQVKSGESVTGVYVFNVPIADRDLVQLEFTWSPKTKPVILTGDVSSP